MKEGGPSKDPIHPIKILGVAIGAGALAALGPKAVEAVGTIFTPPSALGDATATPETRARLEQLETHASDEPQKEASLGE